MNKILCIAILVLLVSLTGCKSEETETASVAAPKILNDMEGRVVESTQAAGYTYALLETNSGQMWFAGPPAELEVGQMVYWNQGAVMNSFNSKTLGKTFDSIMFINAYLKEPAGPPAAQPVEVTQSVPRGEVLSVQPAAGYMYLEVKFESGNLWVAAPVADVKVGDQVEWSGGSLMKNFSSKTLERTFDEIYFASAVVKVND